MEFHDRRAGHGSHPSNWTEKASNHHSIYCERLLRRGKSKPPTADRPNRPFFFRISETCKQRRSTWPTFQCRNPVFQGRIYPRVGLRCVGRLKQETCCQANYIHTVSKISGLLKYLQFKWHSHVITGLYRKESLK